MLIAALIVGLSSCKDDQIKVTDEQPKTKAELLTQASWNLDSILTDTYVDGKLVYSEAELYVGLVEFSTDGKVTTKMPGDDDEIEEYTLKGDSLLIDGTKMYIVELTEKKIELYTEEQELDDELKAVITSKISVTLKR